MYALYPAYPRSTISILMYDETIKSIETVKEIIEEKCTFLWIEGKV